LRADWDLAIVAALSAQAAECTKLRERIIELAALKRRHGYRRIHCKESLLAENRELSLTADSTNAPY